MLNKKTTDILYSAEKGHQMMPFLLLVRQILFKDFPKSLANSEELVEDLSNNTSTNCTATFADCET
ncbi:hypothetical protein VITU9109_13492 [Vibrio tubiashii ATCC 19109]|uniref:Transposase n=1 Tax=Vibrio tubiashii ATCC 19109 TaxID=1051646 RepID=A0ABP2LFJ3_9VIBR|nr:hypothetical protein VITU9109_13492 [Vibrio tubiashii ATCC 19109]